MASLLKTLSHDIDKLRYYAESLCRKYRLRTSDTYDILHEALLKVYDAVRKRPYMAARFSISSEQRCCYICRSIRTSAITLVKKEASSARNNTHLSHIESKARRPDGYDEWRYAAHLHTRIRARLGEHGGLAFEILIGATTFEEYEILMGISHRTAVRRFTEGLPVLRRAAEQVIREEHGRNAVDVLVKSFMRLRLEHGADDFPRGLLQILRGIDRSADARTKDRR